MLKSQRNQRSGKLPKCLCVTAGMVGEEVDDQSSVKLCSFGSGVCPCPCTCDCAASQGFFLHPQLSGQETMAFR